MVHWSEMMVVQITDYKFYQNDRIWFETQYFEGALPFPLCSGTNTPNHSLFTLKLECARLAIFSQHQNCLWSAFLFLSFVTDLILLLKAPTFCIGAFILKESNSRQEVAFLLLLHGIDKTLPLQVVFNQEPGECSIEKHTSNHITFRVRQTFYRSLNCDIWILVFDYQ